LFSIPGYGLPIQRQGGKKGFLVSASLQVQENVKAAKEYDRTEDDLKALQSVGQIIGEVLRQLDSERCMSLPEDSTHPPFLLIQYLEKSVTKNCYCQNRALLGFHNL
jgi:ATP-dependent 26S proteasome regulatory subunit